jgi:hypothetical protein
MAGKKQNEPRRSIHQLARYSPAIRELAAILCRSLFAPLFMVLVFWELRDGYNTSSLNGSVCRSVLYLIPVIFLSVFIAQALRPTGMVKKFFNWNDGLRKELRRCVLLILWGRPTVAIFLFVDSNL